MGNSGGKISPRKAKAFRFADLDNAPAYRCCPFKFLHKGGPKLDARHYE